MADSSVPSSNSDNMDSFPLFKNFTEPKETDDAFTVDKRDIKELQSNTAAKSTPASQISGQNDIPVKKPNVHHAAQCDICSVLLSGEKDYNSHIKGRKHQAQLTTFVSKNPQYKPLTYQELCSKNQDSVTTNKQNVKPEVSVSETKSESALSTDNNLICHICNVTCNSQRMFDDHINGKKHQTKLKLHNLTTAGPTRLPPDNNPSSSNYCDVCSVQLSSETKLTEHLSQKRHQQRVKEEEFCTKEAATMNISFDDYEITATDDKKNWFSYQCKICNKKFGNKVKLIEHLKSALHTQLANQSRNEHLSPNSNRGNYQSVRRGTSRTTRGTSSQSFPSSRGSRKPLDRSRVPYRSQDSSWTQQTQSFNQSSNQQLSNNPFGAFDPDNQSAYSTNISYQYPTKRFTQPIDISDEYSGFYPKRQRTYNNESDTAQYSYSTYGNYVPSSTYPEYSLNSQNYSSQPTNYNNQSTASQSSMPYPSDSYYSSQQTSHSVPDYSNSIDYSSGQPPLPNYEAPPPPPPSSSSSTQNYYPEYAPYTGNQNNTSYTQQSYHY